MTSTSPASQGGEASPRVSLLVPIYNVERYLDRCLRSAQEQTLQDIEVICINDGSTDGSRGIVEQYLVDRRFRVIDKPNSGYGASMNRGLASARGRYVAILESDDYLELDALERMHDVAERNAAEVVKADFFLYWSTPHDRNETFGFVTPSMAAEGVVSPREDTRVFYLKPSIWSGLYRADFLRRYGIGFLETPGASYQDSGFNFKVWACARRVVFLQDAFLHYRQDNEASSVNSPGKMWCVCDEYAEMDRFLREDIADGEELMGVLRKMQYDSFMWNYERLTPELQLEFLRRVSKDFSAYLADGSVDLELFEPWKREDLRRIVDDVERYHARRAAFARLGRPGKALHYLTMCGPSMMATIARQKTRARE